ncbi:phosphoribosylformylglycinamidine synthase subunit PurL [Candidatus Woesearchaeota archaeon]|nr:phosphoribosylformylglycinamidine synthase subunit PurL [Candidatus Woesearchaeota archaeon]
MLRVEIYPKGRDFRGDALKKSLYEDLGIDCSCVAVADVYSIDGINDSEKVVAELFSDPLVNECFDGNRSFSSSWIIEVAYKKGVQDPSELSALRALQDIGEMPSSVKASKKTIIAGVSEAEAKRIALFIANPVIQEYKLGFEKVSLVDKPYVFSESQISIVEIIGRNDSDLVEISRKGLLSLNIEEMRAIRDYFLGLGRNPTDGEIETIAQTWSEHCKHKTFSSIIDYSENGRTVVIDGLFSSTIVAATKKIRKDWLVSVFKDNAGIIKFDENNNLAFKVETHNHPSALDPYGGAGTGIGGVIRDILGAGLGANPIFNTDVFCFASPDYSGEIPGKILAPKRIMKGVVSGVRDYGNRMGIPTINGSIIFNDDFLGAPLVFCGTCGLIPSGLEKKRASPGELIVVVGGRTGRDGIHGATFSSAVLDESSPASAVQIGNAIEEKCTMDALLRARDRGLYSCVTDCGGGGFSSAIGEMAAGCGAVVYLEKAPLKYEGMSPWEIWISESQERMIISIPKRNLDKFLAVCRVEEVDAFVIGELNDTGKLVVKYNGKNLVDLDMDFLHNGLPRRRRIASWKAPVLSEPELPEKGDYSDVLIKLISHPTIASKEWVIRQYDHEVQASTVIKPLVGAFNDGPGDASVVKPLSSSIRGVVVAHGINPLFSMIDPYWMAASAIDEAMRNIVSVGGNPGHTAILDNFCWGSVNDESLGRLVRASKACHDFSIMFDIPFISGKDSLHNEFVIGDRKISIPDTLLISAISVIGDVGRCVTMDAKKAGNSVYIVSRTYDELGGSYYYGLYGETGKNVPIVRENARIAFERIHSAISGGLVRSCHDCSEGGIAVSAAEMAFSGNLGMSISLDKVPFEGKSRDDKVLFSESNSRFIVEVEKGMEEKFESAMEGVEVARIGEITAGRDFIVHGLDGKIVVNAAISSLKNSWQGTFRW